MPMKFNWRWVVVPGILIMAGLIAWMRLRDSKVIATENEEG